MTNVPKGSDTLYKSCNICCKIFKVSDDFGALCLKDQKITVTADKKT